MFTLLDGFKLGLGAIVGALIAGSAITILANVSWIPDAKEEARQQERAASLQKAMQLIEQRSKTNAEIRNLDDAGLCRELGGMLVNNVCQ